MSPMSNRRLRFAFVALLASTACTRIDPCPEGSRGSDSRQTCILLDSDSVDGGEAGVPPDESPEAGSPGNPMDGSVQDAQMDAEPLDATDEGGADLDAAPNYAGEHDASPPDAGDAGETPLACSPEDQAAWGTFHLSGEVVQSIGECFARAPVACAKGLCPLDDCLREKAQVTSCDQCVTAEIQCVMTHCKGACGASDTDDSCRACACAHDCIAAFDACALEPLDVCADCDGTTCANASLLPPELIMVVISPLL